MAQTNDTQEFDPAQEGKGKEPTTNQGGESQDVGQGNDGSRANERDEQDSDDADLVQDSQEGSDGYDPDSDNSEGDDLEEGLEAVSIDDNEEADIAPVNDVAEDETAKPNGMFALFLIS